MDDKTKNKSEEKKEPKKKLSPISEFFIELGKKAIAKTFESTGENVFTAMAPLRTRLEADKVPPEAMQDILDTACGVWVATQLALLCQNAESRVDNAGKAMSAVCLYENTEEQIREPLAKAMNGLADVVGIIAGTLFAAFQTADAVEIGRVLYAFSQEQCNNDPTKAAMKMTVDDILRPAKLAALGDEARQADVTLSGSAWLSLGDFNMATKFDKKIRPSKN